jgi:pSer/pThr/pTyr-binding forkhead associated (FHA) protein
MATLCLINGDGEVAGKWELGEKRVTVGRGLAVDEKVNDEGLSRRHFMIARENEDYVLKDLSSRNGTWVEGARAAVAPLRHNDAILAGRSEFRFREDAVFPDMTFPPRTGPHDTVIIPFALLACDAQP